MIVRKKVLDLVANGMKRQDFKAAALHSGMFLSWEIFKEQSTNKNLISIETFVICKHNQRSSDSFYNGLLLDSRVELSFQYLEIDGLRIVFITATSLWTT